MNQIVKITLIFLGALVLFFFLSAKVSFAVDCNPYPPLSGTYTITTTPSCSFAGTPNGADNGGITVSTGVNLIIPANATVAWTSGQSITINGTGSISINATGASLSKTNLWMVDADADGWPGTSTQTASGTSPGGTYARRYTLNSGSFSTSTGSWTLDCNDASYSTTNTCCTPTTWYQDSDGDGYGNANVTTSSCTQPAGYVANSSDCNDSSANVYQNVGSTATDADQDGYYTGASGTNCVGASTVVSGRTYYKATSASYTWLATAGALGSSDCDDANVNAWRLRHRDADGDTYGAAGTTCVGNDAGYVDDATDCYDSNANAHPGQTAYYTTNRGDGSFDYNCSGANEVGYSTACKGSPFTYPDSFAVEYGSCITQSTAGNDLISTASNTECGAATASNGIYITCTSYGKYPNCSGSTVYSPSTQGTLSCH